MASSTQRYPLAVAIPTLSFVAIVLCIPPLILQWKNRNFPATCLSLWFVVLNVFNIVNALIWPNDDIASWWNGEGLCDVEVKFMIAGYVGVPGALLCIFRSLAIVLDTSRASLVPSQSQRWRKRFIELLFCVIVPIIAMIDHIVIQPARYYLFSISGCVNAFDESWVTIVLSWMWPPIILLIAACYCCLVMLRLHRYRRQFGEILQSSNSKLNKSRFLRLFFMAFVMLLGILPFSLWMLSYNINLALPTWHPYSWNVVHGPNWNTPIMLPSGGSVFFDRYNAIVGSIITFFFFGFGRDATKLYRSCLAFLGFDRCFPSLSHEDSRPTTLRANSTTSMVGSISSRAKLLFHHKRSVGSRTYSNNSVTSGTLNSSSNEVEKGISRPQKNLSSGKSSWFKARLSRNPFARGQRSMASVPDLSAPSTTVCTNAWADKSLTQSVDRDTETSLSPDREKFIRVKQVISQQSEMHV